MEQAAGLQFDRAEFTKPGALNCGGCNQPLNEDYFTIGGRPVCASCRGKIENSLAITPQKLLSGFFWGFGATVLAAIILAAGSSMRSGHGLPFGRLGAGLLVGYAVRRGSRRVGGWQAQTIAMVLAYLAVSGSIAIGTYASPGLGADEPGLRLLTAVVMLVAGPFLAWKGIIAPLFIAFPLYIAWRANIRVPLQIIGPLRPNWLPEKLTPEPRPEVVTSA